MTITQSILLGVIQGLTEFLPISSSAHLVLMPYFFGWQIPIKEAFIFDVLVQTATLLGVIAYFWKDLFAIIKSMLRAILAKQPLSSFEARLGWLIILACLPVGILGLMLKSTVEAAFNSPPATAIFLFCTALLMALAEWLGKRQRSLQQITWQDALWIGFFQVLAVFPGLSRSGSTISAGMLRGLDRPPSARFSFLLSVPIMIAAGMVALLDLSGIPNVSGLILSYIPGFAAAGVVGYVSIRWLLNYLTRRPLYIFSVYCASLALITLIVYYVRG